MIIAAEACIRASIGIAAAGGCLSALEFLSLHRMFRPGGLFSWDAQRQRPRLRRLRPVLAFCEPLFEWPAIMLLVGVRAAFALACVFAALMGSVPWPLLAIYVSASLLFFLRSPDLTDGAEQMIMIVSVACLVAELAVTAPAKRAALFFLAAQLSLSYGTAGLSKLRDAGWRDGNFLIGVLSTAALGREAIYRPLRDRPGMARRLSWMVILGEIVIGFTPWVPVPVCLVLLAGALAFHIAAAVVMGLNTFVFAFAAAFPAALFSSGALFHGPM